VNLQWWGAASGGIEPPLGGAGAQRPAQRPLRVRSCPGRGAGCKGGCSAGGIWRRWWTGAMTCAAACATPGAVVLMSRGVCVTTRWHAATPRHALHCNFSTLAGGGVIF